MPPRKRAKASAASTPLAESQSQPKTPADSGAVAESPAQTSPQNENTLNDPWTDDQETQLFKSMIKWKPTGIHKHFRMISIHNNLRSHGFATETTPHTRIPGIWNKLNQLYDLNVLDQRENAYAFSDQPDPNDDEDEEDLPEFQLPEEDFGELIWARRFHSSDVEPTSSPPLIPNSETKRLYKPGYGLLDDNLEVAKEETESKASPAPKAKGVARGGRGAARGGRGAKAAKNSKAQSTVSESAEESEEEEEEEEESEESEEETTPKTTKGGRGANRGRPTRRGRRR